MERGRSGQLAAGNTACGGCPENIAHDTGKKTNGPMEIRGFMTLAEVSKKHNVPIHCLKTHLGIPASVPDAEKLGRLKENYKFTMSDVARVIAEYRGER